jgi:hypothetical protein
MQVSSSEEVLKAVKSIPKAILQRELKSAFGYWAHRCDWIVTHNNEYYQEWSKISLFTFQRIYSWIAIGKAYWISSANF